MKKLITAILATMFCFTATIAMTACSPVKDEIGTVLRVITNADFPPFEYMDGKEFAGFDMDLIRLIAAEMEVELEFIHIDFDSVVTSVQKNKADVALAALTVNETRKKAINFSDSYWTASQMVVYKNESDAVHGLDKADDIIELLKGKKIGFQRGTTAQFFVEGDEDWGFDQISSNVESYDNVVLAGVGYGNGNVDYIVTDELPAKELAEKNNWLVKDVALTQEEYAIGVHKKRSKLLAAINEALAKLKANGEIDRLAEQYLGEAVEM